MVLGIDPKVDIAFRKLFGGEDTAPLLVDLLNAVVGPLRPVTGVEVVLAQSGRSHPADKETFGDVKARDQGGRQFQVEMKWASEWFFRKRLLFYWGQFHTRQLRQGEHYMTLRPTVAISFLNQPLFGDVEGHHLVFQAREVKHGVRLSDDFELHLIELPKFTKKPDELESQLDRWCYFLRHGADLDLATLPAGLDVPVIRRAMEVLAVWTQEEREREVYEQRLKAQRDAAAFRDAYQQRLDDAEQRAKEAMEKGMLLGKIATYQEMLKQPPTPDAELEAMSVKDLTSLLAQLRQQIASNGHGREG